MLFVSRSHQNYQNGAMSSQLTGEGGWGEQCGSIALTVLPWIVSCELMVNPSPPPPVGDMGPGAPVGALVHKTSYAPMIYTALYIMFLMRADPLRGQVGGGWAPEISTFLAA